MEGVLNIIHVGVSTGKSKSTDYIIDEYSCSSDVLNRQLKISKIEDREVLFRFPTCTPKITHSRYLFIEALRDSLDISENDFYLESNDLFELNIVVFKNLHKYTYLTFKLIYFLMRHDSGEFNFKSDFLKCYAIEQNFLKSLYTCYKFRNIIRHPILAGTKITGFFKLKKTPNKKLYEALKKNKGTNLNIFFNSFIGLSRYLKLKKIKEEKKDILKLYNYF